MSTPTPAGTYNSWASTLAPGHYGAIAPKFALGPGSDDYNPAPGARAIRTLTALVITDTANAAISANTATQMVSALATTVASFIASITADLKTMSLLVKKIMVKLNIQ